MFARRRLPAGTSTMIDPLEFLAVPHCGI